MQPTAGLDAIIYNILFDAFIAWMIFVLAFATIGAVIALVSHIIQAIKHEN